MYLQTLIKFVLCQRTLYEQLHPEIAMKIRFAVKLELTVNSRQFQGISAAQLLPKVFMAISRQIHLPQRYHTPVSINSE